MCDTLVALSNSTKNNSVIFAKNSDREPNEPQIIIRIPSKTYEKGRKVKCTYIEVEQKETTNEVILVKPSWIWGAEMGVNSKGLVIGNEAVFTKEKLEPEALLGMDMLRLALENCDNAAEAVEYIISMLGRYGQGGKAGYTANLRYHNSFIIADYKEAYVLETAGRFWVVKAVQEVHTISNVLTLRKDFDGCSDGVIENAVEKKWCRSKEDFDFKRCYEDKLFAFGTQGDFRHANTESFLRENIGRIDMPSMMDILRNHCGQHKVQSFKAGSMKSVCMHGGGIISSQTTGSLIVELKADSINLWVTGSSIPCISLFKPMWFTSESDVYFTEKDQPAAVKQWSEIEKLHRAVIDNRVEDLTAFYAERDRKEEQLLEMAEAAVDEAAKTAAMKYAAEAERELLQLLSQSISHKSRNSMDITRLYYNTYWKKQNNNFQA
ncbi:MAG: peptidase dipeptidase [Clostridia bacterium]|jgi:dipeptidase|nr:peptidase dipeptidase [Clostridia bacterium]